jgi:pyrrolysine biosynthesis protein PylD
MTRLTMSDVRSIKISLPSYDRELLRKTGHGLRQIACLAAGCDEKNIAGILARTQAAVVPMTSGQGVIEGFTEAVLGIIEHIGAPCFRTTESDVTGLAEAVERGARVIFLADDSRFIAFDVRNSRIIDNDEATARGYVAALALLAGTLKNKSVLVIGGGRVGRRAIHALLDFGARPVVYDSDPAVTRTLKDEGMAEVEKELEEALRKHSLLFVAAPAPGIIQAQYIKSHTAIAACGLPLGLSDEAAKRVSDRLIHDPLQIGVAAMLIMAAAGQGEKRYGAGGRSERSHRP